MKMITDAYDNYSDDQSDLQDIYSSTGEIDEDKLYESLERALKGKMYSEEDGDRIILENARRYGQDV